MRTLEFDWYDAWVLAAVLFASKEYSPVLLWRVVAAGDALNKAIFTRDELELAFGRLVRADYIQVGIDGFAVTAKALELDVTNPAIESIARAIGAKLWSPSASTSTTPDETYVSRDAYAGAVKKYEKEFWQRYRSSASSKE